MRCGHLRRHRHDARRDVGSPAPNRPSALREGPGPRSGHGRWRRRRRSACCGSRQRAQLFQRHGRRHGDFAGLKPCYCVLRNTVPVLRQPCRGHARHRPHLPAAVAALPRAAGGAAAAARLARLLRRRAVRGAPPEQRLPEAALQLLKLVPVGALLRRRRLRPRRRRVQLGDFDGGHGGGAARGSSPAAEAARAPAGEAGAQRMAVPRGARRRSERAVVKQNTPGENGAASYQPGCVVFKLTTIRFRGLG